MTNGRAKTANLRRDRRPSLHATSPDFWSWTVVEGDAQLSGPATAPDDAVVDGLVDLYRTLSGEHPDGDEHRAAMVADRRVLLSLLVTHVSVRGRVVEITDEEGLRDVDRLSQHHNGRDHPDRERPRVSARVEIDRWHSWGAAARTRWASSRCRPGSYFRGARARGGPADARPPDPTWCWARWTSRWASVCCAPPPSRWWRPVRGRR